jgi:hypothetical protein
MPCARSSDVFVSFVSDPAAELMEEVLLLVDLLEHTLMVALDQTQTLVPDRVDQITDTLESHLTEPTKIADLHPIGHGVGVPSFAVRITDELRVVAAARPEAAGVVGDLLDRSPNFLLGAGFRHPVNVREV